MFTVNAGKYESDGERNYKYCADFKTLEEAIAAHDTVRDYPWSEITITDGDYVYAIEPTRVQRRSDVPGSPYFYPCQPDGTPT